MAKKKKYKSPRPMDRYLKTRKHGDLIEWCPICEREVIYEESEPLRGRLYHPECADRERDREATAERMRDDVID